jgi:DNA-binding HxlR family transcriptional regulator
MPAFEFRAKRYNNPVELALDVIGGKWKMPILWRLRQRVWRYGELKKDLPRVSHKVLTEQLRELEADGLITRTAHASVPPRVEYALSELGKSALPTIESLRAFGSTYREQAAPRSARTR